MNPSLQWLIKGPRSIICVGLGTTLIGVSAESFVSTPQRFDSVWYPQWFWIPTTIVLMATTVWAALNPTGYRMQVVSIVYVVWCGVRAVTNLARLSWPGFNNGMLWLGFGIVAYGIGLASSATEGAVKADSRTDPESAEL